mgnify:CR=1 FL=1
MTGPRTRLLCLMVLSACAPAGHLATGAQAPCCGDRGLAIAYQYRVEGLEQRRFDHSEYWKALDAALVADRSGRVRVTPLGRSIEGRAINAVTTGVGPTSVLLWSQMHGDESTASMSLADLIHWFAASPDADTLRRTLERHLTITMIPMLNPDGAQRFIRHNALGVDVNRDALRLATPEGRVLKAVRDSLDADFGFNLHDQGPRSAGPDGDLVAVALLAPAADEERTWGPVRQRARQVAAVIAGALQAEIPGSIARYDDSFTPRAFGDNMQIWGTATVLIESGMLPDDPEKQELRRLNVLALLAALESIADGSFESAPGAAYDDLPLNVGLTNDLLLTGGRVVMGGGESFPVDVAVVFDDPIARTGPRYGQIGDLSGVRAVETIDVSGLFIHPDSDLLIRGEPAYLSVRRGVTSGSEQVLRVGAED